MNNEENKESLQRENLRQMLYEKNMIFLFGGARRSWIIGKDGMAFFDGKLTIEKKSLEEAMALIEKHSDVLVTAYINHEDSFVDYAQDFYFPELKDSKELWSFKDKLQQAYTEIWKTMMYPMTMRGKPKADDIIKKHFPFLKPE